MLGMKSLMFAAIVVSAIFLFSGVSAGDSWGSYPGCGNDVNFNFHFKYDTCKDPQLNDSHGPNKCIGKDNIVVAFDKSNGNVITRVMTAVNGQFKCPGTKHGAAYMVYRGIEYNTCACPPGTQFCAGYWGYCGLSA
eukprot:Nk52_evm1s2445 gene=Nk52_evmTU1s2445